MNTTPDTESHRVLGRAGRGTFGLALLGFAALDLMVYDLWIGRPGFALGLALAAPAALATAVPPIRRPALAWQLAIAVLFVHQVLLLATVDSSPVGLALVVVLPIVAILGSDALPSLAWFPLAGLALAGLWLRVDLVGSGAVGAEEFWFSLGALALGAGVVGLLLYDRRQTAVELTRVRGAMHRATAAEAAAEERLADAREDQSWLLAALSHELRTPLMSMMLSAELLQMSVDDEEQRSIAHSLGRGVEALTSVLDDVGDLSRVGSGEIELNRREFAVQSLVEETVALMAPLAADHNTLLIADIDPYMPAIWTGDPARLRQIVVNLLGGALKRADEGVIGVTATATGDRQLEIAVVDAGPDASTDAIDILFGAHADDDVPVRPREVGRGLGPAIARELVEVLDGELLMRSSPEGGCRFTLRCCSPADDSPVVDHNPAPGHRGQSFAVNSPDGPIREPATRRVLRWMGAWGLDYRVDAPTVVELGPPDGRHRHVVDLAAQFSSATPAAAPPGDEQRNESITVGVVDDDPSARNMMARSLKALGYRAVAIPTGLEALAAADRGMIDVLLLDVHMPGVGGLETLRRLRAREGHGATMPICMVSGNAVNERASSEAGADRFLLKPVRINVLGSVLHELLPRSGKAEATSGSAP